MSKAATKRQRISPQDLKSRSHVRMRGSYDAAQTTHQNANHWSAADHLSANAAHHPAVRSTLRNRSRYEYANNSYCRGMLLTAANDIVGTGPRLQVMHEDREAAHAIERAFALWSREVRLAEKLRALVLAKKRDGEGFVMKVTNPNLRHPVKLDLRLIECDHITTPMPTLNRPQLTDGIVFDDFGNPAAYHVLKRHPGEHEFAGVTAAPLETDTINAKHIRHLFRLERPGQTRGVPEITPALPLYALLRRWTLAVVQSAENIADLTLLLKSSFPPDDEDDGMSLEAFDPVELERGLMAALPDGYEPWQTKAEQPGGTYVEGKNAILNEIARCLNMPFNIAAGNSAGYNYSSAQRDHQTYYKSNSVERDDIECGILEWVFAEWLAEATRLPNYLPLPDADASIDHEWYWDGVEHVDRAKEANGRKTDLETGATTLAYEYARQGRDWEQAFHQRAKENMLKTELQLKAIQHRKKLMEQLGLDEDDVPPDDTSATADVDVEAIGSAVESALEESTA